MKKFLCIAVFAALLSPVASFAQNKDRIEGSGNQVTKEFTVSSFDALQVSGAFSVILSQGSKEGVTIEADDNLQSLFEVKNEGSKLIVSTKKESNYNSKKSVKVYIRFKSLTSMDLKTVGDVKCEQTLSFNDLKLTNKSVGSVNLDLKANSLTIENSSVGDVNLKGSAETASIKNSSVGDFNATKLVVQQMDINSSGIGSTEVNAAKELKVRDSMLSKVRNSGAAVAKKKNKQVI